VSDRLEVPPEAGGLRLDRFLADHVGSRSAAERAVETGVLVNGERRPKSWRVSPGEVVEFEHAPDQEGLSAEDIPVRIAYEDEHVFVVDKPAGLVVHPGAGRATGTLVHALLGRIAGGDDPERPGIVHRLDRDTSGLLVVTRTDEAYEVLQELVRRHALEREYLALVRGRPRSRRGRIEAPIGRDRKEPTRISLDTDTPRDAVTHFEVEELFPRNALLRVKLETGRMHQIRVHLASIGLPVSGDPVYGVPETGLRRQFLHAARLAFPHPVSGAPVDVQSPLPDDLQAVLDALRRDQSERGHRDRG
jgi:23S rRNA pseudouridine1911/1915/1917 synthase